MTDHELAESVRKWMLKHMGDCIRCARALAVEGVSFCETTVAADALLKELEH